MGNSSISNLIHEKRLDILMEKVRPLFSETYIMGYKQTWWNQNQIPSVVNSSDNNLTLVTYLQPNSRQCLF